jgi:GAF domain-containing protein/signal transduction histidine kinase
MEKNKLFKSLIEAVGTAFELDEVLQVICMELQKIFHVDRVGIAIYPKIENYYRWVRLTEYKTAPDILSLHDFNFSTEFQLYLKDYVLEQDRDLILDNVQKSDQPDFFKEAHKTIGTKSMITIPIKKGNDKWGILGIFQNSRHRHWTEKEVGLLHTIVDYIYAAMRQAELYSKTKQQAEREALLRKIIETIRSNLNIDEVLTIICDEMGKLFNVQRATIVEFPEKDSYKTWITRQEYTKGTKVKGIVDFQFHDQIGNYWGKQLHDKGLPLVIDNIEESDAPDFFKKNYGGLGVKSVIGIPIIMEKEKKGLIALSEYNYYRHWTKEEQIFLHTIGDQVNIAIKQVELYEKEKQTAKREKLLRDITETIRSSLDIEQIKIEIVRSVAQALTIDRTFMVEFDPKINKYIPLKYEYLLNPNVKSMIGFDPETEAPEMSTFSKLEDETIVYDIDELIKKHQLENTPTGIFLKNYNIKSGFNIAIRYSDRFYGTLSCNYSKKSAFSREQIEFAKVLASQTAMALYQAELYEKEKQTAKREKLLRDITNTIRSILDLKSIKHEIVNEIGKVLNCDRVIFAEFNQQTKTYLIDESSEYLSRLDLRSFVNFDFSTFPGFKYLQSRHERKKDVIYRDLNKFLDEKNLKESNLEEFCRYFDIQALLAICIVYKDEFLGNLFIQYTKIHNFTDEELEFIRTLASQAGVAIYQSRLYQTATEATNREYLLRNITTTIRSTLNLKDIKNKIVNEIGKALNCSRVIFAEFNQQTRTYLIDESSEYLSSPEQKSYIGFDIMNNPVFQNTYKVFYEKKIDSFLGNVEEILEKNNLQGSSLDEIRKMFNFKAQVVLCIIYKDQYLGNLIIQYDKIYNFTEDEIKFMKALANQASVAIYQANLYEKIKQNAEKERLLREIVTEIRLSHSMDQVYKYILKKFTDVFAFDKTFFMEIPEFDSQTLKINYQFDKTTQSYESQNVIFPQISIDHLIEIINTQSKRLVDNTDNYFSNNKELQGFLKKHNVKSFFISTITKYNKEKIVFGIIVLYSDKVTNLSQYEIDLFEEILNLTAAVLWEISKREEIDELRNTFILTLAHDLQVPLIGERRALEFIMSIPPGELLDKYKHIIAETIKNNINLSKFLAKLVDSYNYELTRKKLFFIETNFSKLIKDVVNSLRSEAEAKSIQLDIELEENLPFIFIDKDEVKKVIYTLLENAITYTQKSGCVIVKIAKQNGFISTCIIDNGPGISEEMQKRLFKRYEMALAIERKIGAGMGLYLSKQIVEAHNGKMEFKSKLNKGTTFCFTLPVSLY